jgi:pilus assembly protein Flp/PilA
MAGVLADRLEFSMKSMKESFLAFLRDEEGLTTVEYAIAGGLVGAGVIGAFALLGGEVFRVIDAIYQALTAIVIT